MTESNRGERQPIPSEDTGDLTQTPPSGQTDDHLVAREEGVPYVPPTERVLSEPRVSEAGADAAGAPADDDEALRLQAGDPDLAARALEALRRSDVAAGDRLQVTAVGTTLVVAGSVDSIDVLDEVLAVLGEVDGAEDVVDRITVAGV